MSASDIIVALDCGDMDRALYIVDALGGAVSIYKVGLELMLNSGGAAVDILHRRKKRVFLDLKFHDIPNTVAQAAQFALSREVFMCNVHASGGMDMLRAVGGAIRAHRAHTYFVAVTVLTSMNAHDVADVYHTEEVDRLTMSLAAMAHEAGLHGVVCSAREAQGIKAKCGDGFITVCPGIRMTDDEGHDQKRMVTPYMAANNGADYLVLGRSITAHADPASRIDRVLREMRGE